MFVIFIALAFRGNICHTHSKMQFEIVENASTISFTQSLEEIKQKESAVPSPQSIGKKVEMKFEIAPLYSTVSFFLNA